MINQISRGDCLIVMQDIPDKSIDMILCDLPYGGVTECKWDILIPLDLLWEQYKRIIKDDRSILLTATPPFSSLLISSNLKMYKYNWYWEKGRGANIHAVQWQPFRVIEEILVFSNGAITFTNGAGGNILFNPQKIPLEKPYTRDHSNDKGGECTFLRQSGHKIGIVEYTHAHPRNLIYASMDREKRYHPTQKPVSLFSYLIKSYTNPGDTVLDNCAGSGTTAIACLKTGRNYICIEKEEKYVQIARDRIQREAGLFQEASKK